MENQSFRKRYFKEGQEVAHKENLSNKMEVRRIIRMTKKAKDKQDIDRKLTLGIECGWWNGEAYCKEVFHTNSLVPWEIAEEGFISVQKYIDSLNNINV